MRLTKLFVVIFVALLIVIGAVAMAQVISRANAPTESAKPQGPVKIAIASAVAAEPWISAAAKEFSGKEYLLNEQKLQVFVEVFPIDGVTALSKWANGEFQTPPTAWVAESRD